MAVAVIHRASSLARNKAQYPTSQPLPSESSMFAFRRRTRRSSSSSCPAMLIGVWMFPATMQFTRTPRGP
jgi:hypothetical protein